MTSFSKILTLSAGFYKLDSSLYSNNYYIISSEGTRHLMASPEVVGYDSYLAMLPPTVRALEYFKEQLQLSEINILTILRGGLNYPIEEACHRCGIKVPTINFMSCERIITDGVITGLDVRYEKVSTEDDCTLVIGDIIASGQTLELCLQHVMGRFRAAKKKIRRIIFFTVGGTKAVSLMERLTDQIRQWCPSFEGFSCVFYEGIFTVYQDKGVTGVNIPDIDFGWKGGVISPEFRKYILEYKESPALLEKCIIYDGGARRYELEEHFKEVKAYWSELKEAAEQGADFNAFIDEKAGYPQGTDFERWAQLNLYEPTAQMQALYQQEQQYIAVLRKMNLAAICTDRLNHLNK